jgi:chromosome segregation ATPase
MTRPIDHSAALLGPGSARASRPASVPWARIVVAFGFVTATGCAIILLAMGWRHELDRRHAIESTVASSSTALQAAQGRIGVLEEQNEALSGRAKRLTARLETARREATQRRDALLSSRRVLRATEAFVAELEGLDETATSLLDDQEHLGTAVGTLAAHVDSLSRYVNKTMEGALDRSALLARLRSTVRDLSALRTILAGMATEKAALDEAVEPLAEATELDATLRSALAHAKRRSSR